MSMMTTSVPLCPDQRGGRRCMCHGTFLGMKHSSGWIHPFEQIDHPSAAWNQGDIYLSEKDVFPGVKLEEGDAVVFYLYVDAKGLGAEKCVPSWHEQAQAMRAEKTAKEVSFASALLAVSTLLQVTQAPAASMSMPIMEPEPSAKSFAVDLSSFYDDDDDEESDLDDTPEELGTAKPIPISLADILEKPEPKELPSAGSALHGAGGCKPCSFFPKGTCTNGPSCDFCHYPHEKEKRPSKNKGKRVRERQKANLARVQTEKLIATSARETPMRRELSAFLQTASKDIFKVGLDRQTSSTCGSTEEGSGDEGSESSTFGSPLCVEREPSLSPPPGLSPPPPSFPPPPMPEFLSAASGRSI